MRLPLLLWLQRLRQRLPRLQSVQRLRHLLRRLLRLRIHHRRCLRLLEQLRLLRLLTLQQLRLHLLLYLLQVTLGIFRRPQEQAEHKVCQAEATSGVECEVASRICLACEVRTKWKDHLVGGWRQAEAPEASGQESGKLAARPCERTPTPGIEVAVHLQCLLQKTPVLQGTPHLHSPSRVRRSCWRECHCEFWHPEHDSAWVCCHQAKRRRLHDHFGYPTLGETHRIEANGRHS